MKHRLRVTPALILFLLSGLLLQPTSAQRRSDLPEALDSEAFWEMIVNFSEEDGFFRYDNFVSNESTYQMVLDKLDEAVSPGGVYIGVGPEQNFTYISALRPSIAFIVDIRRQNMLEHLLYKALFELSRNRVEFISLLFSRDPPTGLDPSSDASGLFEAFRNARPDEGLFERTEMTVVDHLSEHHKFRLSPTDLKTIDYIYRAFFEEGPNLSYGTHSFQSSGPTYTELMTATDEQGRSRSYLASEDNFRFVKQLQERNLVIPLVGDFAGDQTLRQVGQYVRDHADTVTTFYTSNVEQYLFEQSDAWRRFYANALTLPRNPASTFVRSASNYFASPIVQRPARWYSLISSMNEQLEAFEGGQIHIYYDVFRMSR